MKRFIINIASALEDAPFGVVVILWVLSAVLFVPAVDFLSKFYTQNQATAFVGWLFFLLAGIMGIMIICCKEVPILFFSVKGSMAVIIGTILAILSFGIVIWLFLYNFTSLIKP